MIHSKMWLVVKPTVGIPLMFGGIVVAALSVHTAILLNTTWFPAFLQGGARPARTSELPVQPAAVQLSDARASGPVLVQVASAVR